MLTLTVRIASTVRVTVSRQRVVSYLGYNMNRFIKASSLVLAAWIGLSLMPRAAGIASLNFGEGTAWAGEDSVDEAKTKSLEALEAITKAVEDFAKKARVEAEQAAKKAREQLRTSIEKACDASLRACQKVCGDDEKCLNACKEGRRQCQATPGPGI